MTIDEAIKHEEEVAKIQENNAKSYPRPDKNVKGSGKRYNTYLKCAEEHRQLAEWLKDYKRLLEQDTVPFDFDLYQAGLMDMPEGMIEVLDKIREEIIDVAGQEKHYDEKWALGLKYAVKIIDKYKAESEE